MKRKDRFNESSPQRIKGPAYPFSGPRLFQDLHRELSAELGRSLTYECLGKMTGHYRGSLHRWCHTVTHPLLIAFMCLLEYLPPARRQVFFDSHCRVFPKLSSYDYQRLKLLDRAAGLTLISGGSDDNRNRFVASLGHECQRCGRKHDCVAGIDIHPPIRFVPVEGMVYVDASLGQRHVSQVAAEIMPKLLTSSVSLLIFNGLWACLSAWHEDILRAAQHKHVILVEARLPNMADAINTVATPIYTITWSSGTPVLERIQIVQNVIKNASAAQYLVKKA